MIVTQTSTTQPHNLQRSWTGIRGSIINPEAKPVLLLFELTLVPYISSSLIVVRQLRLRGGPNSIDFCYGMHADLQLRQVASGIPTLL